MDLTSVRNMNVYIQLSYFLTHLVIHSIVEGRNLPADEITNQPTEKLDNFILEEESIDNQDRQSRVETLSKKKRKQVARQNKALLINTSTDQERVFNEIKIVTKNFFTNENTNRGFVELIDYFKTTTESSIFLKSVHWIQNEMNIYLSESIRSANVSEKVSSAFSGTSDANGQLTPENIEISFTTSSTRIADHEKLLVDVDDLIIKLLQRRSIEQLIRLQFDGVRKILTLTV